MKNQCYVLSILLLLKGIVVLSSKDILKIIGCIPLLSRLLTIQKFGMRDVINCLEKRFKICHIYIPIRKPKVAFFVFHFVLLYFFPYPNECLRHISLIFLKSALHIIR